MATKTIPSDGAQTKRILNLTQADSPYTLDRNDCPCLIHNLGATGAVVVNLPTNCKGGEEIFVVVAAAQDIQLEPGASGGIYASNGTAFAKQADGKFVNGDAAGERIHLIADANGDFWAVDQSVAGPANAFSEVEA